MDMIKRNHQNEIEIVGGKESHHIDTQMTDMKSEKEVVRILTRTEEASMPRNMNRLSNIEHSSPEKSLREKNRLLMDN